MFVSLFKGGALLEKLYEELFHETEDYTGTKHPKILLADSRKVDLNQFSLQLNDLADACTENDIELIITLLKVIIPEYQANQMPTTGAIITADSHSVVH